MLHRRSSRLSVLIPVVLLFIHTTLASGSIEGINGPLYNLFIATDQPTQKALLEYTEHTALNPATFENESSFKGGDPSCSKIDHDRDYLTYLKKSVPAKFWNLSPPEVLMVDQLKGKKVLSIGEGESHLIANLLDYGADAYGSDCEYMWGPDGRLQGTIAKDPIIASHLERYFPADATEIDIAVERHFGKNMRFDFILAHALLCELTMEQATETLVRSLKILRPGGSFRAFIVHHIPSNLNPSQCEDDQHWVIGHSVLRIKDIVGKILSVVKTRLEADGIYFDAFLFDECIVTILELKRKLIGVPIRNEVFRKHRLPAS